MLFRSPTELASVSGIRQRQAGNRRQFCRPVGVRGESCEISHRLLAARTNLTLLTKLLTAFDETELPAPNQLVSVLYRLYGMNMPTVGDVIDTKRQKESFLGHYMHCCLFDIAENCTAF